MRPVFDRHTVRVYYCDTDAAGVVYHGNYLRFTEMARTEMLRRRGLDLGKMRAEYGIEFVVTQVTLRYRRPARYNDQLEIRTGITNLHVRGLTIQQDVFLQGGEQPLVESSVDMVSIGRDFRPTRIPEPLLAKLRD